MSCRLPGNCDSPEKFWKLLCSKRDTLRDIPENRFEVNDEIYAKAPTPGKMYVKKGAFLNDVEHFDNEKFNQDIFIYIVDAEGGTEPANYYIELETMSLSDLESTMMTLQSLRTLASR